MKAEKGQNAMSLFSKIIFGFTICYSVGFVFPYIFYYIPFYNAIREPFLYMPYLILPLTFFVGQGIDLLKSDIFSLKEIKKKLVCPAGAFIVLAICLVGILLPYRLVWINVILAVMLVCAYCSNYLLKKYHFKKVIVCGFLIFAFILQITVNVTGTKRVNGFKDLYARIERQKSNNEIIINSIPVQTDKAVRFLGYGATAWSKNSLSLNQMNDALGYVNPLPRAAQLASTASERALLGNIKYWLSSSDTESYHYQRLDELSSQHIGNVQVYPTYDSDDSESFAVWELETLGAAWVINDVIETKELKYLTDEEVEDMLNSPDVDFANQAYVSKPGCADSVEQGDNEWTTNVKEYGNNSIKYEVSTERKAILVTPEIWYPGWNVYVDGIKQEVIQVNCCYRGCEVPAGVHTVEFIYQPISLYLGILLSVLGILCWFVLFWMFKRRRGIQCG